MVTDIINAAKELIKFTKMNEYPEKCTPEFVRLTELLDKLDTELRRYETPAPVELCKHNIPIDDICDECAKEMGLRSCEQCGEIAWDGRICHSCGMKEI